MGNLRQKYTDEEWAELCEKNDDCRNVNTILKSSIGDENFDFTRTSDNLMDKYTEYRKDQDNKLEEAARNKGMMGSEVGAKYSDDKAPMGIMLRQFPLALEGVAQRSLYGHRKYEEFDHDWFNFKRAPDPINQYLNATVRHLAEIGDDEDSLEHLKAAAWNILATLQITLEKKKNEQ